MSPAAKRFPKPAFDDVLKIYSTDPESVHLCAILNPTAQSDGINTCAARMSEALCLANGIAADRSAIARSKVSKGVYPLLGGYGYTVFGNLCSHHHGVYIVPINLNGHRSVKIEDGHLSFRL